MRRSLRGVIFFTDSANFFSQFNLWDFASLIFATRRKKFRGVNEQRPSWRRFSERVRALSIHKYAFKFEYFTRNRITAWGCARQKQQLSAKASTNIVD